MPTTAPLEPTLFDRLASMPPGAWLIIAALLAVFVRWVQLRIASAGGPDESVARNQMTDIYLLLRQSVNSGEEKLTEARAAAERARMVLREMDFAAIDPRRILLHDDRPIRPMAAFPRMIRGRLVLLGSGRIVLVSESAFEKLLEADQALATRGVTDRVEDDDGEERD